MITDVKAFAKQLSLNTTVPVACFDRRTFESWAYPEKLPGEFSFTELPKGLSQFSESPDYLVTDSFSYFGYVASYSTDYSLIIGPVFSTPVSEETLHLVMHEWGVPGNERENVRLAVNTFPRYTFAQFLNLLVFAHFCPNDELIDASTYFSLNKTEGTREIDERHTEELFAAHETRTFHNTYYFEREMLGYIENGNAAALDELLQSAANLRSGLLADNTLRQERNQFIVTATLVTRSAIAGGVSPDEAYQLCDVYIQQCERSRTVKAVSVLSYTMLMDFTKRVAARKVPEGVSPEVFEAIQYMVRHTHDPIGVNDVAGHVGKSRSALHRRFSEELGMGVGEYITKAKIDEAKELLSYTDKTLSEISEYLCFSSQAYFQNVFKKQCGQTPLAYRKETRQ